MDRDKIDRYGVVVIAFILFLLFVIFLMSPEEFINWISS